MNTLGHLALGGNRPEHLLGQFLGDFVRGSVDELPYSNAILRGIRAHRRIDAVGDRHSFTHAAKALLPASERRYGGIVLDLYSDLLLHANWTRVMPADLDRFIDHAHALLTDPPVPLPPNAARHARIVVDHGLLMAYADPDELGAILDRIGRRLRRPVRLSPLLHKLLRRETWFHDAFPAYFEDMRAESDRILFES